MRIFKISKVIWHDVFYNPSQAIVWFLFAVVNPIANLIFWRGAYDSSKLASQGWGSVDILTYFLLLILGGGVLLSQIDWDVAYEDIFNGKLTHLILRPFNYILYKFLIELPWKASQAFYGIIFIIFYITVLHGKIVLVNTPLELLLAVVTCILGYLLSFVFKMIIGFTAFWFTEYSGIQQMFEVLVIVCAGFVIPLMLFPEPLRMLIIKLPFAYMIYYPLIAMIGKLSSLELVLVITHQLIYIVLFGILLRLLWKHGLKKFTGVGN